MLRPDRHYTPEEVLPHSGDMLFLDGIAGYGDDSIETFVDIRCDSMLAVVDGVPAWVGIEYMAQSVAAYSGIELLQRGEKPRIGVLLGARSYQTQVSVFLLGSRLEIHSTMIFCDDVGVAVFNCEIWCSGTQVAQAQIKAYRPDNIESLLGATPL